MNSKYRHLFAALLLFSLFAVSNRSSLAQVRQPLVSPYASVSEEVGLTDITIKYARPAVKGRKIWGGLVPYGLTPAVPNFGNGKAHPWRAGANRNTTISFEHDVLVEGQKLSAGTYGLSMIPSEGDWTIVFNKDATLWGAFFYEESEDALRVTVTPEKAPFKERLTYEFSDEDGQGGLTIALLWEELRVPFRVQVDNYHHVVLASMEDELFHRGGFTWQNYAAVANYSLNNDTDLDVGMKWADRAIAANNTFLTQSLKGRFLMREGKFAEADAFMAPLIEASTENELNFYGYQLMGMGLMNKAKETFELNVQRHPDSWNPYDSLAECYNNLGDGASAVKYYRMALEKLPANDQVNHNRIEQALQSIEM